MSVRPGDAAHLDGLDTDVADDRAYRALAHRDRRRILRSIGAGEQPVGELSAAAGIGQPETSQHLRVLRDAGLVTVRADGPRRLYSVDFTRLAQVKAFLDIFWNQALASLKDVAEGISDQELRSAANAARTEDAS